MRVRLPKKQNHNLLITLNTIKEKYNYENELNWGGKKLIKVNSKNEEINENYRVFTSNLKYSSGLIEKVVEPLIEKINGNCEIELSVKEQDLFIFINHASIKLEKQSIFEKQNLNYIEKNIRISIDLAIDLLDIIVKKKEK